MNQFSLAFAPLLPPAVLLALGLAGIVVVALGLLRRQRAVWLRALGLALVLLALTDPSLVREDRTPLKQVVAVVVDRSGSQTIGDRLAQTDAAAAELTARLKALGNVDVRTIDGGLGGGDNEGTQLFAALNAGLADVPAEQVAGVFMITDGVVHDVPASAATLGFKAPLHALITGHDGERDRRVELVEAPRFGIVGKDQTIQLKVLDTADRGEPVTLNVRRDGSPVATLRAAVGETIAVPVRIEHGGPNVVELEVAALPDELTALNNKAVVTIEGVRDKLKVLLVSGEPHNGERMWRNLLKSDANVDLVHFTILRPPEKQDGTPINELSLIAFPTADLFGRKIKDFDLIIFDRYSNQSVLPPVYLENIVRYVRDGGALMLAAGPDFSRSEGIFFSPIGKIAPARPDGTLIERGFRAVVSGDGAQHPVTRGLVGADQAPPAWSPWFRQIGASVTRGTSVMNGADNKPVLVLSREGKGRVAELLSDQMWLWARGYEGGGPYLDLLRRLAHWLMKEPDLEEEALARHRAGAQAGHRAPEPQAAGAARHRDDAVRQDRQPAARRRRARPVARRAGDPRTRPLQGGRRRSLHPDQRRAGEPQGVPGGRLDARQAARDRRGDRRHRAAHRGRRGRRRHPAPPADDARQPDLRRLGLCRDQAHRREPGHGHRPGAAGDRLRRPAGPARQPDPRLAL